MSYFSRTHGDYKPVVVLDSGVGTSNTTPGWSDGVDKTTSAETVQPQGPKLEFFTITGNGSQVLDNIATVFQTVSQLSTIHMYEYTNATDDTLAIAVYPVGAWTTTTLDDALTAAWGSANVAVTATATFTN